MADVSRRDFVKKGLALGMALPFMNSFPLSWIKAHENIDEVVIVGAGAAGLTAGYLLNRLGIEVQILEASSIYGGRVKRLEGFTTVPLDLGAEWIHTDPSILADIVDNPDINVDIETIVYNPQTIANWVGGRLHRQNWASLFYSEHKFKHTTWYGFLEQYIAPGVLGITSFNSPVTSIDYSAEKVSVNTVNGRQFVADKVIVTVPVNILQSNTIRFTPEIPDHQKQAIDSIFMGDGIKAFIEFSERFYPDIVLFGRVFEALNSYDKTYFDAVFGKETGKNILGLFAINDKANPYTRLGSDEEMIGKILAELDEIFQGDASKYYQKHAIQNWSKEPFIQGSYSYYFDSDDYSYMSDIFEPLENKVFFAGEATSKNNQATVHGACESAFEVIESMMSG